MGDEPSCAFATSLITTQNRSLILDIFDRAVVKPEISLLLALDTLIGRLKNAGLWERHDLFYLPCLHEAPTSYLNLSNLDAFTLVPSGGVTLTPFEGAKGNGVDGYFNTGFNITTSGVEFQKSYMDAGFWSIVHFTATAYEVGVNNSAFNVVLNPIDNSGRFAFRAARAGGNPTYFMPPAEYRNRLGYSAIDRYSSTDVAAFRNGVMIGALDNDDNSATALQNSTITLFKTATVFSPGALKWVGIGSALNAEQHRDRYRILAQFFTTLEGLRWL
jgi:hypothetical protein